MAPTPFTRTVFARVNPSHCHLRFSAFRGTLQRRGARIQDCRFVGTNRPAEDVLNRYQARLEEKARREGHSSIAELRAAYTDWHQKSPQQPKTDQSLDFSRQNSKGDFRGRVTQQSDARGPEFVENQKSPIPQAPQVPLSQPNKDAPGYTPDPMHPLSKDTPTISDTPEAPARQQKQEIPSESPSETDGQARIPQAPKTPVSQPNRGPLETQLNTSAFGAGPDKAPIKSLNDILDLAKVGHLPDKELSAIWRLHFASNPRALTAVIPASSYLAMEETARSSPQFILPVPHESQGAEIHFLQWTFDAASRTSTILFTQLAEFKLRGEFAQPHTTITHHLDFLEDRKQVLMQGQVVEGRGVQPDQAKWLAMCVQRFYGGWDVGKGEVNAKQVERATRCRQLLNWFAKGDERFSVERLMDEAERIG